MNPTGKASCIVCGKELQIDGATAPVVKTADQRNCMNMTMGGVDCIAFGNYGSVVFDPMDDEHVLGFVICDACFRQKQHLMIPVVKEKRNDS